MTTEENIPVNVPQSELPPFKIAFIIDNEVIDILHTDERLAAIFLSNPTIVDVTSLYAEGPEKIINGSKYDPETKTFTLPTA